MYKHGKHRRNWLNPKIAISQVAGQSCFLTRSSDRNSKKCHFHQNIQTIVIQTDTTNDRMNSALSRILHMILMAVTSVNFLSSLTGNCFLIVAYLFGVLCSQHAAASRARAPSASLPRSLLLSGWRRREARSFATSSLITWPRLFS